MYNVEEYINECIHSIINQPINHSDYEIIAVDDGSPDDSGKIVMSIKDLYPEYNIKLYRQENKGLSGARNAGLKMAKGEYVWFIDSDDWVSSNSLSIIFNVINKYHPEALHISSADWIRDQPVRIFSLKHLENKSMTGLEVIRSSEFHGVVQYTIYKRSFLIENNLSFMEGIYHEDTEFSPRAYYFLKDIRFIDDVLYLKRVNPNSITQLVNSKKNLDLIKVSKSLQQFARNIDIKENRRLFMRFSANTFKMALTNEYNQMSSDTIKIINLEAYKNRRLLKSFFVSDRKSDSLQGIVLYLGQHDMVHTFNRFFRNGIYKSIR